MLYIVATPIGNSQDISLRALDILKNCDVVVLEEPKEGIQQLKALGIIIPKVEKLNEHSDEKDLQFLLELCRTKKVALMSDCGTPGFCDPGSRLVKICRQNNVSMQTLPGASSLMAILSLSSERIDRFSFEGFLPRDSKERADKLQSLIKHSQAFIVLETPYRCGKLLEELRHVNRRVLIAINLTQENEYIWEGPGALIPKDLPEDGEIIVLFYSGPQLSRPQARPSTPPRSRPPSRRRR